MKKITQLAVAAAAFALPAIAAAQTVDLNNVGTAVQSLTKIINLLIPFFIGLAVLVFIYGLIKYVLSAGNAEARTEARGYIIYGIIGIAVMVGVFGLVRLLLNTFNLGAGNNTVGNLPCVPVGGGGSTGC